MPSPLYQWMSASPARPATREEPPPGLTPDEWAVVLVLREIGNRTGNTRALHVERDREGSVKVWTEEGRTIRVGG